MPTKIIEVEFNPAKPLLPQIENLSRRECVHEGYRIIERFRRGFVSSDECDRLELILEDLG